MLILVDLFRYLSRYWVAMAFVSAIGLWGAVFSWPLFTQLTVVFCDAGQGDEMLIQQGFTQVLIDGSQPGRALECLSRHMPFFDREIDALVLSHPQTDHFGGFSDVLDSYDVRLFVYSGIAGESEEWRRFSELLAREGAEVKVAAAGDRLRVGEAELAVVWPAARSPAGGRQVLGVKAAGELNSYSLVLWLRYGEFDALFTGDIGEEEERAILATKGQTFQGQTLEGLTFGSRGETEVLEVLEVLKVPHHGSKHSSSEAFLRALRPALAVIEVGKNGYGHPAPEALERLSAVGAKVMRTDRDGDVIVRTDGKKWGWLSKFP